MAKPKVKKFTGYGSPHEHFGEWSIYYGHFRHYEEERPLEDKTKIILSIKRGRRRLLVKGEIRLEEVHYSRETLADYLYEYRFYPSNNRQLAKLLKPCSRDTQKRN